MATWRFGFLWVFLRPRDASDAAGPLVRLADPAARGRACCPWRLALGSSLVLGRATPRRRGAPAEFGVSCDRGARGGSSPRNGSYDI